MNEEWFLQLTLSELQEIERALGLDTATEVTNMALKKVQAVIDTAMNWETPLREIVGTPSRGELPDA